ncbi:hypothetical protein C0995_015688 [Termitomyces sp. Mi166|nr:hypothetical protein C0995_015688 [Termitomyces sp. Mi166\
MHPRLISSTLTLLLHTRQPILLLLPPNAPSRVSYLADQQASPTLSEMAALLQQFGADVALHILQVQTLTSGLLAPPQSGVPQDMLHSSHTSLPDPMSIPASLPGTSRAHAHSSMLGAHSAIPPSSIMNPLPSITHATTQPVNSTSTGLLQPPPNIIFRQSAPSFVTTPGSNSVSLAPTTILNPSTSQTLLRAPPLISMLLNPNILSIPIWIQQVFNAGWSMYVLLDALTNSVCARAMSAPNQLGNTSLFLSTSGELQLMGTKFDLSKEKDIQPVDFMQASSTLVSVIHHCLKAGPESKIGRATVQAIADAFAKHYLQIHQRPDFSKNFKAYLAYNIYIQHSYLQNNGNLRVEDWHNKVFNKKLQLLQTDNIC